MERHAKAERVNGKPPVADEEGDMAEFSGLFDQIPRWLAYRAIWFPLWFRLLGRVSPAPTDEELDRRERKAFEQELQRIIDEKEELDE
jgi:hypothetical protein